MQRHAALSLELFGGPVLYRGERTVSMSPYQVSLLTLLLAEGRERLPRRQLQQLLWGPGEADKTRHRLSQLLYQVNQKVRQRLAEVEGDGVKVFQGIVGCDLDVFEEHIGRPDFKAAGDLVRRGFLAAFPAPPSEAFEDWMDLRRVEIRARLREKALTYWAAAEASQDWGIGRQAAEALLLLNPRDEVILRRVMKARAMGGMVREAEAVYLGFADRQARLGEWEPEPETAELLASVRATVQRPQPPPDIAVPPSLEVPLCGRDGELGFLTRSVFQDSRGGRRSTVVVGGEAGLGKTRLVKEALQGARFRGYQVLTATPAELERNIPLNPLLEALNQKWVGRVLLDLEDPWRSVLLSMMPQFHEGPGPLPTVPYVQPGSLTRRTYEAFFRLFRALSKQTPTLLFVDDFQWVDETSAAVLQFMHRRWPTGDLGLVVAYRPGDLDQGDLNGRFVSELEADGDVVTIRLEELDERASKELVKSVASERLSDTALREVVGLAGGNPFFLVELTADYVADRTPERRMDGAPLPLSVRQMIARRIRELDPVAKQIVSGLSVSVQPLSLGRLTNMTGFAREECVDGLETLQRLRLVDWAERGVSCRHDIVRRAVYDGLSAARRSLLHGRIAEMLESEPGDPPKDQLALHYYKAGERSLALKYALAAAEDAEASGGHEEVRTALALAMRVSDGQTRASIGARLSISSFTSRRLADCIEQGRDVLSESDLLSAPERLRLELTIANAERLLGRRSAEETLQVLKRVRAEASLHQAHELCLEVLDTTLHVLDRAGDIAGAAELVRGLREEGPYGTPSAECRALLIQTMAFLYGDVDRGLAAGRRAVALARDANLERARLQALNRLLLGLLLSGQLESDEGRDVVAESLKCARSSGDIVSHALLLSNLASWHLSVADWEAAAGFLDQLQRRIEATDSPFLRFLYHANRGALWLETGSPGHALKELSQAADSATAAVSPHQFQQFRAVQAMALIESGRLGEAMEISQELDLPRTWSADASELFLFRARLDSRRGQPERGVDLLELGMGMSRASMPVAWLRMACESLRLRRRMGGEAPDVARAASELAADLRLPYLSERFRPYVT